MARSSSTDLAPYIFPAFASFILYQVYDKLFGKKEDPGGEVTIDKRPATIDQAQARIISAALEIAFWGDSVIAAPTEDEPAVIYAMELANVTNDVKLIIDEYGYRGQMTNMMDLPATIAAYLDQDDRAKINADYEAKGITDRF